MKPYIFFADRVPGVPRIFGESPKIYACYRREMGKHRAHWHSVARRWKLSPHNMEWNLDPDASDMHPDFLFRKN